MTSPAARNPRATLIADRGAAAAGPQFFRSPSFLAAEGVSHSLEIRSSTGRTLLPLVVRPIPGTSDLDAVSPYGYPGGTVEGNVVDPADCDFSATGLVSIFVRDRLDRPTLRGGTARGGVQVHDPRTPRSVSKTFARNVRRCEREGFQVEVLPGPAVDDRTLDEFATAYTQTMQRAGAAERYFFTRDYLRRCLDFDRSWLAVVRDVGGELAAAELAVASDGHLHSYLAATADRHRLSSPGKSATLRLMDLADELAHPLNFGGGMSSGDGIEASKLGYANSCLEYRTHELIVDGRRYADLSAGRSGADGFFPSYRSRPSAS